MGSEAIKIDEKGGAYFVTRAEGEEANEIMQLAYKLMRVLGAED